MRKPQLPQNLKPGGTGVLQAGQGRSVDSCAEAGGGEATGAANGETGGGDAPGGGPNGEAAPEGGANGDGPGVTDSGEGIAPGCDLGLLGGMPGKDGPPAAGGGVNGVGAMNGAPPNGEGGAAGVPVAGSCPGSAIIVFAIAAAP
jgi:hypothetical protein